MADRLEWEGLLTSIAHELPQPVEQETARDGSVVLVGGDPGEVIVRVTRSAVAVSEYTVEWHGPHNPVVCPIAFGTLHWRRMPEVHALAALQILLRAARESRRAKYRTCGYCEKSSPPEALHNDRVCQECAQKHLGIVY